MTIALTTGTYTREDRAAHIDIDAPYNGDVSFSVKRQVVQIDDDGKTTITEAPATSRVLSAIATDVIDTPLGKLTMAQVVGIVVLAVDHYRAEDVKAAQP